MDDFLPNPYLYPFQLPSFEVAALPRKLSKSSTAKDYSELFDEIVYQALKPCFLLMGLVGFRPSFVGIFNGLDGASSDMPVLSIDEYKITFNQAKIWVGKQQIDGFASDIVVVIPLHEIKSLEDNPAAESIWTYIKQENFGLDEVGDHQQKALTFRFPDYADFSFGNSETKQSDGPNLSGKLTGAVKDFTEAVATQFCSLIPETDIAGAIRKGALGLLSVLDIENWLVKNVTYIGGEGCESCFYKSAGYIWQYITTSREHLISFFYGEWGGDPGDLVTDENLHLNSNYLDPANPVLGRPLSELYLKVFYFLQTYIDGDTPEIDIRYIVGQMPTYPPWEAKHVTYSQFLWLLHPVFIRILPYEREDYVCENCVSGLPAMKNFPDTIKLDPLIEDSLQEALGNIDPDTRETVVPYYLTSKEEGTDIILAHNAIIGEEPATQAEKGAHVSLFHPNYGVSRAPFGTVHNHPIRYIDTGIEPDLKVYPSGITYVAAEKKYKGDLSFFVKEDYAALPYFVLVAQIKNSKLEYVLAYRKPVAVADIPLVSDHEDQSDVQDTASIMEQLFPGNAAVYTAIIPISVTDKEGSSYNDYEWPPGTVLNRVAPNPQPVKITYRKP